MHWSKALTTKEGEMLDDTQSMAALAFACFTLTPSAIGFCQSTQLT
jgi:hypothetical protein